MEPIDGRAKHALHAGIAGGCTDGLSTITGSVLHFCRK